MATGAYNAVIFDLFGTLVDEWGSRLEPIYREVAQALGIPDEQFRPVWSETYQDRQTGAFPTLEDNFRHVAQVLETQVSPQRIAQAIAIRHELTRQVLIPRPDAEDTLRTLRAKGLKIGLISNCSQEVPELWEEMSIAPLIDESLFSSVVGLMKPDQRIYELACQRLGVDPQQCLYVGDSGYELTGASQAGMHPVLIRTRYDEIPMAFGPDATEWPGLRISTLAEVLDHL